MTDTETIDHLLQGGVLEKESWKSSQKKRLLTIGYKSIQGEKNVTKNC